MTDNLHCKTSAYQWIRVHRLHVGFIYRAFTRLLCVNFLQKSTLKCYVFLHNLFGLITSFKNCQVNLE